MRLPNEEDLRKFPNEIRTPARNLETAKASLDKKQVRWRASRFAEKIATIEARLAEEISNAEETALAACERAIENLQQKFTAELAQAQVEYRQTETSLGRDLGRAQAAVAAEKIEEDRRDVQRAEVAKVWAHNAAWDNGRVRVAALARSGRYDTFEGDVARVDAMANAAATRQGRG